MSYGKEIVKLTELFFKDFEIKDPEAIEFMKQDGIENTIKVFKEEVEAAEFLTVETIGNIMNATKEKAGAKGKMLFMPLRIATTGQMHGPDLKLSIELIGKEEILKRL
jgi:nondiscriminating glutamyl-tRNA synthetase